MINRCSAIPAAIPSRNHAILSPPFPFNKVVNGFSDPLVPLSLSRLRGKMWAEKGGEIMSKAELELRFNQALKDFTNEISFLDDYSKTPVTEGQLKDSMKQVLYALDSFRDAILNYMD